MVLHRKFATASEDYFVVISTLTWYILLLTHSHEVVAYVEAKVYADLVL